MSLRATLRHLICGLSCVLSLSVATPAQATLVKAYALPGLAQDAVQVVRVRVLSLSPDLSGPRPQTRVELAVLDDYLQGSLPPTLERTPLEKLTLSIPGGERPNGIGFRIPGMPRFQPGEELVLFLEANGRGDLSPLGLEQGIYRVYRTGQSGFVVRQSHAELHIWSEETGQKSPLQGTQVVRLDQFEAQLRGLLRTRAEGHLR